MTGELASAIRSKTNLHFGLYYSLFEWFNPLFIQDQANNFSTRDFVTVSYIVVCGDYFPYKKWFQIVNKSVSQWGFRSFKKLLFLSIFRTVEHFAAKLGMGVHQQNPELYESFLKSQGQGEVILCVSFFVKHGLNRSTFCYPAWYVAVSCHSLHKCHCLNYLPLSADISRSHLRYKFAVSPTLPMI